MTRQSPVSSAGNGTQQRYQRMHAEAGFVGPDMLVTLQDIERLRAALLKAIGTRPTRRAVVGLFVDDRVTVAAAGSDIADEPSDQVPRIRIGCLVKLLTATLILDAVAAGRVDLEASVLDYLPDCGERTAQWAALTVRRLLEHTHGIDDSLIGIDCPTSSDRIDVRFLGRQIAVTAPLTAPGQMYSYSHVGSLLLAAVLERRFATSYAVILRERLLEPLGIRLADAWQSAEGGYLSPAFDEQLSLTVADVMRLIRHGARTCLERSPLAVTGLPGWSPVERGICLGWKAYGDGWYGHASDLRDYLTIVKVHADSGTVLLASSADFAPSALMLAVFGRLLPRSHQLRFPRILTAQERCGVDFGVYATEFENAALTVSLHRVDPAALGVRVVNRLSRSDDRDTVARAIPARDEVFVCEGSAGDFSVFQLLGRQEDGFRYLWNGKALLRRSAVSDPSGANAAGNIT